ncbi:MAG: VWA domain-containing protein [Flavobacteriales bacterium]|nr:VWA domain-containing protein [Flavobacteriales bacterium]
MKKSPHTHTLHVVKTTVLLTLFLFQLFPVFSQIIFDKSFHDFGQLKQGNKLFVDFKLTNAGNKTANIIRIEEPYGISYRISKKMIEPDSTVTIRFKYIPKRKEVFERNILVYISTLSEPLIFTLKGEALYANPKENLEVTEFETEKKTDIPLHQLTINVVDANTKEPINNAILEILWDGLQYKKVSTNAQGKIMQQLYSDNYYFLAYAPGYSMQETAVMLETDNQSITIELGEKKQNQILVENKKDSLILPEEKETSTEKNNELDINRYAPNNVVFLLDISVSMKQKGRLDLMKVAMIELVQMLRPIDKLSIVTYSSTTEVVMESIAVTDKASIIKVIQNLEAGGLTAGGKGLKKAYQVAEKSQIKEGNNQILIATDGAFNLEKGDKDMLSQAKNAAEKKNITLTVVGVINEKWTEKSMKSLATEGKGNYISIKNYNDAKSVLVEEIKRNSFKL